MPGEAGALREDATMVCRQWVLPLANKVPCSDSSQTSHGNLVTELRSSPQPRHKAALFLSLLSDAGGLAELADHVRLRCLSSEEHSFGGHPFNDYSCGTKYSLPLSGSSAVQMCLGPEGFPKMQESSKKIGTAPQLTFWAHSDCPVSTLLPQNSL